MTNPRPALLMLVLAACVAAAGCGQKGPLYLPGETPPSDESSGESGE